MGRDVLLIVTDGNNQKIMGFGDPRLSGSEFGLDAPPQGYSRGFYKSVMMWLKCLFTEEGTDISDPEYGTPLATLINGNVASARDAQNSAFMSVDMATIKLREYQTAKASSSAETITNVSVTNIFSPTPDVLEVQVSIHNAANETMSLRLPIDIS